MTDIYLIDDGTMDTVFECGWCGEQLRYSSEHFSRDEDTGELEEGAEEEAWEDHADECDAVVDLICGETGKVLGRVSERAVDECSHRGACDADVAHWEPRTEWLADADTLRDYVRRTGLEDVDKMSDETVREYVLWIACGDLKENSEENQ